jgi:6-phosphogluconolactonase
VEVLADADAAARRGARLIAEAALAAITEHGSFSLALSGGAAPWRMFELLGDQEIDFNDAEIFQVDERVAPDGDPERNLTHFRRSLPEAALARLHPMPVTDRDLDAAAARYERELPGALDLVHLGLGTDGHTASLVPGDAVLEVVNRRVAPTAGKYRGRRRLTLTYAALGNARRLVWLVTGGDKRDPLARLLAGDRSIPAGRVEAAEALVLADRAAAPEG